jgi:hypothetical protein
MAIPTYQKTEAGRLAWKERSPLLTGKQRSAFILFDGVRSTLEVLNATVGLGMTPDDIDLMEQHGFIEALASSWGGLYPSPGKPSASAAGADSADDDSEPGTASPYETHLPSGLTQDQDRYQAAYLLATQLTANLGLRGFRLNLAVESASSLEQLRELAPKIREAIGPEKARQFERALGLRVR